MCIRDSAYTGRLMGLSGDQLAARVDQVIELLELQERRKVRTDRLSGCLLYTSDAADERSSVDLGGRRIIKKKKNNRHNYRV